MPASRRLDLPLAALTAALALSAGARAVGIRYVDDNAPPGGNGLDWPTAYRYLQDALTDAQNPGNNVILIRVGQGTYRPDANAAHPGGTLDRSATFQLITGLTVRGGFRGVQAGEGQDPFERDPVLFPSILSGDLLGNDGQGFVGTEENSYHVVTTSFIGPTAVLEGFVVTSGSADGVGDFGNGAGLISVAGLPTIRDCTFTANRAELFGGAVYLTNAANATFQDCTFTGNLADLGGAVAGLSGTPTITGCTFEDDLALVFGGALFAGTSATVTVSDSAFRSNIAVDAGGAVYTSTTSMLVVSDTSFCDNDPDHVFGPVTDDGGNVFLADCDATCPTDLDGTGDTGFSDLIIFLVAWGPCPGCAEDFDGSGDVGFADLFVILAAWGPCP